MSDLILNFTDMTAFWAAAGGALVGAISSSFFAYWIQNRAFKKEEKVRAAELQRSQQVLGRSLIIKLVKITANIRAIHQHLEGAFLKQEQNPDGTMKPWQFVQILAVHPDSVQISSDELSMLMGLGDNDVFGKVLNIEIVHKDILGLLKTYEFDREMLFDRIPITRVQGTVLDTDLDKSLPAAILAQMNIVDDLAKQLRDRAESGYCKSRQTLEVLCSLLHEELGLQHGIEFPETANDAPSGGS